jgi:transposase
MSMTIDNLHIRGTAEYQTAHFRGFWQRAKNRLEEERSAHEDELRRLDATHRHRLSELERSLAKRLEDEFNRKFHELEGKYRTQVEVYRGRIAELESELSLFRDQVKSGGNKENLNFSGDRVHPRNRRKKGGKKQGAPGGRLLHLELPVVNDEVKLEEDQRLCKYCGLSYEPINASEDSEVVEWQYRLVRIRRRRRKYHRSCQCPGSAPILTAPVVPRAMPQSKYGDQFWIEVLVNKYAYQIPTEMTCELLAGHGLVGIRPQTLSAGIERIALLLEPLSEATQAHNLESSLNQADESSIGVFVDGSHREYFYQYTTVDTVVCKHTASRCGREIADYLRSGNTKHLVSDRHSLYKSSAVKALEDLVICFCWVHVRRDFIKIGRYQRGHRTWAMGYLRIIRRLFRLNRQRCKALGKGNDQRFSQCDRQLREKLEQLRQGSEKELAVENLVGVRRKPLKSLLKHWSGLLVFVDHPEVPMDNNRPERNWRDLARFRRNCYGVFSDKFARVTAQLMTVMMTLKINRIALVPYLQEYFKACAEAGGQAPASLDGLLPWALSAEIEQRVRRQTSTFEDTS